MLVYINSLTTVSPRFLRLEHTEETWRPGCIIRLRNNAVRRNNERLRFSYIQLKRTAGPPLIKCRQKIIADIQITHCSSLKRKCLHLTVIHIAVGQHVFKIPPTCFDKVRNLDTTASWDRHRNKTCLKLRLVAVEPHSDKKCPHKAIFKKKFLITHTCCGNIWCGAASLLHEGDKRRTTPEDWRRFNTSAPQRREWKMACDHKVKFLLPVEPQKVHVKADGESCQSKFTNILPGLC